MRLKLLRFILILTLPGSCLASGILRSCRALNDSTSESQGFDLTALVTYTLHIAGRQTIYIDDNTGICRVTYPNSHPSIQTGCIIRLQGHLEPSPFIPSHRRILATNCVTIGLADKPTPHRIALTEACHEKHNRHVVCIRGVLRDIRKGENDPLWKIMNLSSSCDSLYVAAPAATTDSGTLEHLIGRTVDITGIIDFYTGKAHAFTGPHLQVADERDIQPVSDSDKDPFTAKSITSLVGLPPLTIAGSGRYKALGSILCTWDGTHALLKTPFNDVVQLDIDSGELPAVGDFIEASGLPLTDMYGITLDHVLWRPAEPSAQQQAPCEDIPGPTTAREILWRSPSGNLSANISYHGKLARFTGIVRRLPDAETHANTLLLEDDTDLLHVNVGNVLKALENVTEGCKLELLGICRLETEPWHPGLCVPRINGFSVIVNEPAHIRVIARPSWWTAERLLIAFASSLVFLIVLIIWNRLLQRLVERRGRALFRSQIDKASADLRTEERTRLAVELHDSISQNLTGVSMQIDAAGRLIDRDRNKCSHHLEIASKTLDSCRKELRNCIWDLRNETVDDSDLNAAIRRTVLRHVEGAKLTIRFNVPRQKFSDNTIHVLLHVIRELATNAVRHGHATEIRIAGTLDDGNLNFSVTDNGCGFDPGIRPGVAEGHFGLQGVSERIKPFGGEMQIDSAPKKGTRICIRFAS